MNDDMLAVIAGVISFWEDSNGAALIQAYPMDWQPNVLYAEWMFAPSVAGRIRKPEICNGFSNIPDFAGQLQDLLRTVEQNYGVVIDHVTMKKDEGHISVLWHVPGQQVRKYGSAPVASAAVPVVNQQSEKKGVA